jgi:uncharacterized protein (UPF0548 family)
MRIVHASSEPTLAKLLRRACDDTPTYPEVGASLAGDTNLRGYHCNRYHIALGDGRDTFARAVEGLRSWQAHRLSGVSVYPEDAGVEEGTTVILGLGKGLAVVAPCRVVAVLEDARRWGFAYGTLPGHPESGEESFIVERSDEGAVRFTVTAFSRPADRLVRLAGPVGRALQQRATDGYLRALRRYVVATGS